MINIGPHVVCFINYTCRSHGCYIGLTLQSAADFEYKTMHDKKVVRSTRRANRLVWARFLCAKLCSNTMLYYMKVVNPELSRLCKSKELHFYTGVHAARCMASYVVKMYGCTVRMCKVV